DNGEEYDDDEDDTEDDKGNDDDDSDGNDDNDGDDDDNDEHEKEENVDEFTDKEDDGENEEESDDGEEFYKDVNVNLKKEDVEMTDVDQGGADQHNETEGPMQSSSVSSDFIEKLLNFENFSLIDNEIASLMDTTVHNEEPSAIVDHYMDNKLGEAIHKAIQSHNAESVFLANSSSQPKSTYKAAASLSEYKLTKILLDKMEESKSHLRADYKRELYDALDKSYNIDKDLFETYGEVFTLKRSRDEKDKDQDPSAGSDRGPKKRKSSKEAESQNIQEEPSHIVDDFGVQKNQESDTGKPYSFDLRKPVQLIPDHRGRQVIPQDYFINNNMEYLKGGSLSRQYSTFVTKTKAATYEIKWIEDKVPNLWIPIKVVYDKHAYWGTSH
nr:hypothetical protein [Tanacetum cinerariifolium]